MEFQVVIPVLIAFAISVILGPVIIPFLRKLKMGQTERTEGVQSHLKKAGTPTMGGVIFLIATAVTALFYVKDYPKIIPVLFLTLGFGIIGFLDDYLKVVLKRSDGLMPAQKFSLSGCADCNFCILYCQIYRYFSDYADSVLERTFSESGMACLSDTVFCSDRYCKRSELYRWTGWSVLPV